LVALDALFARCISQRRVLFVMLITGVGSIGGLVFQLLDAVFKMSDDIRVLALYLEWQLILLFGIGLALTYAGRDPWPDQRGVYDEKPA
jgi:hypothetical protein